MVLSKMKPTNAPTNKSVVSKMVNTASTSADPKLHKEQNSNSFSNYRTKMASFLS